jgi:hypothetical protein
MINTEKLLAYAIDNYRYENGNLYWIKPGAKRTVGSVAGTKGDPRGYVRLSIHIDGKHHRVLAHRAIFLMHHGYLPHEIDHIDGNPLNNRIENLREVTKSENLSNTKIYRNNTSGTKGVSPCKTGWIVAVSKNHIRWRWHFEDKELAELVALEAREKIHGKFARNL